MEEDNESTEISNNSIIYFVNSSNSINHNNNQSETASFPKENIEYFNEIYTNLLLDEKYANCKLNINYMKNQCDINERMRAILVDWIIEIQDFLHLERKTIFLTIYIMDLYLSKNIIEKKKFQLLSIACLLSSSKINGFQRPIVGKLVQLSDNCCNKEELRQMEIKVMKCLKFEVFLPTAEEFYNIISKQYKFERKQRLVGEYFLDCSLLSYELLKYKPSVIAAACAYIVMKYFHISEYENLYNFPFTLEDSQQAIVKKCALDLCFLVKNISNLNTFNGIIKYSKEKYGNVANLFK